jgi:hypothetical protein
VAEIRIRYKLSTYRNYHGAAAAQQAQSYDLSLAAVVACLLQVASSDGINMLIINA